MTTPAREPVFDDLLQHAWTLMISDPARALSLVHQAPTGMTLSQSQRCQLYFHEGWCHIFLGDYLEALKWLSQALTLGEVLEDDDQIKRISNGIGMAYHSMGQYAQALQHYERALELNQQSGDLNGIFAALLNLAALHYEIEELDSAESLLNEALGLDTRTVTRENLGEAALLQAHMHGKQQRFEFALLACRAALNYARELDYDHLEIQALIAVARCQRLQIRLVEAETTLQVTIDHPEFDKEGVAGLNAYIELAKTQATTGRFSHSVRTLRRGLRREGLPEFSLIQQRALETLSVCLEKARKYRAAMLVMRLALDMERKLQNQDIRRQMELRRFQSEMDAERLARRITDHENKLLKATQSRLQLINALARQLAASLRIDEIGRTLYAIVAERLDVHFVSLALNRPEAEAIEFQMIIDSGDELPVYSIPYQVDTSRAVYTVLHSEPVLVGDETSNTQAHWIGDRKLLPRSQLFIPLIHNHQVLGMFSLQSAIENRFTHDELDLLTSLAPFVAITLSNALSHQRLSELNQALTHEKTQIETAHQRIEHMANHDTLTGLPNRRLLAEFVEDKVLCANAHGVGFYLVYIDLDGFKPVNDRYGHRVGDKVLTVLSHRLRDSLRKTDFAARVGGDEFIIIVDDFDNRSALDAFIRRILNVIEKPVHVGQDRLGVSASIGVARYGQHGADLDHLMHHADLAMYGIKRSGKGGIAYADALLPIQPSSV